MQCQYLTTRWSSRDAQTDFPPSSAILLAPRCAQMHTLVLKPVLSPLCSLAHLQAQGLQCSCSGTQVAILGITVRPPVLSVSCPRCPAQAPTPSVTQIQREPQPGWAGVRKDHLDKCGCNFPGSLSGLDRNSHADGGSLEPQSDSGFLRTL